MAYVRSKTIKGHRYYYLVEGYRQGGKVKQRMLAYFGAAEPSAAQVAAVKKQLANNEGNDEQTERDDGQLRQTIYDIFDGFELTVRHNLSGRTGVAGQVLLSGSEPVAVSLVKEPDIDVLLHELGHVIDFSYRPRFGVRRMVELIVETVRGPSETRQLLLEESMRLASNKYLFEFLKMTRLAKELDTAGELAMGDAMELQKLQEFFDDYAATEDEGFANAFALYILDPDQAKRVAPTHCDLIHEIMNREPDMQEIVTDLQSDVT